MPYKHAELQDCDSAVRSAVGNSMLGRDIGGLPMSVQNAFLALLSLGPAYGSQLQAEFLARAAHRRQLNAGQVYSTLDRLTDQGLVESAGSTDDGLPLYALTDAGREQALAWLSEGPTD